VGAVAEVQEVLGRSETRHSWSTVSPPTPESNIAIGSERSGVIAPDYRTVDRLRRPGRVQPLSEERLRGHHVDRQDHEDAGGDADLGELPAERLELGPRACRPAPPGRARRARSARLRLGMKKPWVSANRMTIATKPQLMKKLPLP
jgi:hypothetical protein